VSGGTVAGDRRLLGRTRWWLTAEIAGVITGVVLLVGGLSWGLMVHGQHDDARRELAGSLSAWSIDHPWPCIWMFEQVGAETRRTPAAPTTLPVRADFARVSKAHPVYVAQHRVGGIDYLVRTEWHPKGPWQAALDLRYQAEERHRLYVALAAGEVAGLLAALLVGWLLAGRAMRPLTEALDRQRRFVADASHELRTPLTQIHTRAQLLARRLRADPPLAEQADALVSGTRQFGEVLDDLLLSAQLARRYLTDVVDLAGIVTAVASAEEARVRRHGLRLAVTGAEAPRTVVGAAAALRRVVNALVDNAIGHTSAGGGINLALAADDGWVTLTVSDDGVGLEPGAATRIFDRFARGTHGAGRRFGLGLALTREIVTGHGGTITAAGTPGNGATFTVRLPAALPGPEQSGPEQSGSDQRSARSASMARTRSAM
jgi:signal transduction histidine kinase